MQLLNDPRTPYQILMLFYDFPQILVSENRAAVDIDEAVLRHEKYIRKLSDTARGPRCLVTLEELCNILHGTHQDVSTMTFARKQPPKGGLEVLDTLRPSNITLHSTKENFASTFERVTRGILRGLNWDNVILAGGMALTTLLHTDMSHDDDQAIKDPDLDMYIYGLGPDSANLKAQEIHDTWVRNLPPDAGNRIIVKNAKTINLITNYPNRRIQIVLKLLPSPTDILLDFDLDACAIAFDGREVFMLPRCARAIETGYSVFTMDLVWGHHLRDRSASQESRIFKYAFRGFGIRFLPSYARALEDDKLESDILNVSQSETDEGSLHQICTSDDEDETSKWTPRDRKPHGKEPGLKTLKRIAYLGQDCVNRFLFGTTPLAIRPIDMPEGAWLRLWDWTETDAKVTRNNNTSLISHGKEPLIVASIDLADLDTNQLHRELPDGMQFPSVLVNKSTISWDVPFFREKIY